MKIHLLHGIHTSEKNETVAGLIPFLEEMTGLEVQYHKYGYALGILTRLQNPGRAEKLAKHIAHGDIVVGHSNGVCLTYLMAKLGAPIGGVVAINAALDSEKTFPNQVMFVDVYYNRFDEAVGFAKSFFLFDHPWGAMGRDGFIGTDSRVTNIDCSSFIYGTNIVKGHSDIFTRRKIRFWGTMMGERIKAFIEGMR
jgi:hypothetical protein